jgi:hypothetical protein
MALADDGEGNTVHIDYISDARRLLIEAGHNVDWREIEDTPVEYTVLTERKNGKRKITHVLGTDGEWHSQNETARPKVRSRQ